MEGLQIFKNSEFGELSVITKNKKEYIEAIPVAEILGYSNPRDAIIRHCRKGGVIFSDVGVVTGKRSDNTDAIQYVTKKFIDEGNLYRLIIRSKLPSAMRFERWIMEEVIPSIRNHGAYLSDDVISKTLENPDFIIQIATKLKQEKEEKFIAQKRAENLEDIITLDRPYTNFGKSIASSSDAITIGQFDKVLNNNNILIGRNRLFSWLRDNGYLIGNGKDKNMPKQVYIEQGLFKVSERIVQTVEGEIISATTLITGKGQLYFLEKIEFYYLCKCK
ncbi:phage antirepressor Ant [Romboutsia weinsteinii]|uniref:Phage antirepressor Ant n=1 Tax=Romboutsia weinsteinii TaxID=2020949 RepID=A0A371J6V8_9FIRM|nr:phage antirepressor KilAC domain-containing protein [Romboutsia weinsteinii]RDY28433.1 phage antirepressor Ant [Romboutsia weinsteinii]